jgi:hypothetical protein
MDPKICLVDMKRKDFAFAGSRKKDSQIFLPVATVSTKLFQIRLRTQTYALDRAATGTGLGRLWASLIKSKYRKQNNLENNIYIFI